MAPTPSPAPFVEDDVKLLDDFGAFITAKSVLKLKVNDAIALNNMLVAYNRLRNKINAHIEAAKRPPELSKMIPPPAAPDAPPTPPTAPEPLPRITASQRPKK